MVRFAAMLLWCAVVAMPLMAQGREALAMLEGSWTIEGSEDSYLETCSWFDGRSHLVCNSETREESGATRGVSVFSWSEEKRRYLYYHYGSSGGARAEDVFIDGDTLYSTSERQSGADLVRSHVTMKRREDGSFDWTRQLSRNAGPWKTVATFHYVRVRAEGERR